MKNILRVAYLATLFIVVNIISYSEIKKIENAETAKPTNMATSTADVVSAMATDIDDSDLPF